MGDATISGIGKVFAQGQSAGVNSDIREEEEKINFLDLMNQMSAQPGDELFSRDAKDAAGGISVKKQPSADEYSRYQYRESNVKSRDTAAAAIDDGHVSEKLQAYAENVKEVLKEELGVTEEQLEEAMQVLGMTVVDLMNPNMLAELVTTLTGSDVSELLCNSEFMTVMQTVNELTQQLLDELGISMEALTEMVQTVEPDFEAALEGTAGETADEVPQDTEASGLVTETVVPEEELQPVSGEPVKEEEEPEKFTVVKENGETLEEPKAMETETLKPVQGSEETAWKGGPSSQNGQTQGETAVFGQHVTEQIHVQGTELQTEITRQVDVSDIIKQIIEYTRVTVGAAQTTMEMQLNPENLGKIYLEITSKAGNVTAHITAQDEVVKEALEAQLSTLKDNMNQAGVKVEAVEVSVGSHEFEKNLEQNAKQDERQAEEQEKATKQTRHINLNDLDELSGVMTEEESLVAQMMAEQGNSVDYTA